MVWAVEAAILFTFLRRGGKRREEFLCSLPRSV
jgi:hypothetical protein